jgi:hypothetical protein
MVLRESCRRSFPTFVDRTSILSEMGGGPAADWIPFRLWPAQQEVARTLEQSRLVVFLKARQLGATWLGLAFGLWRLLCHPIATVLLFSRRDDEAVDLLARLRAMHSRLPPWLQAAGVPLVDNDHELQLPGGSRVLAFPTTAGDSYTADFVLVDEADLVPDLDRLLRAVKPTIDAKGRLLLVSRADKGDPESTFKRIYRAARAGKNDWTPVFLPWSARPDRTADWYDAQRRDIEARTGAEDDLHEQYPATDVEALAPRSLDRRLPPSWLTRCFEPAQPVTLGRGAPAIPGLTVYLLPEHGRRYVIGADPAEGNPTSDESALEVIDEETGEEVAHLAGRYEPATFAAHLAAVGRWFNHAPVMVERNNHGHAVLLWLADNSRLLRLCGHDGQPGWHTTSKGKALLYDCAAEALRDDETTLHAEATYHQLSSIEGATLRAPEGQADDRATAFALALAGRARVRRWAGTGQPSEPPCLLLPGRGDPYGPLDAFGPGGQGKGGATGYGIESDVGRGCWVDPSWADRLDPFQGWRPG